MTAPIHPSGKSAILSAMPEDSLYDALANFLTTFSAESPLLWALLVMAVIAVAGLVLYGFWEIVLRGLGLIFGGRGEGGSPGSGHGHGHGHESAHGGR